MISDGGRFFLELMSCCNFLESNKPAATKGRFMVQKAALADHPQPSTTTAESSPSPAGSNYTTAVETVGSQVKP